MRLSRVVFPEPFGPIRAVTSPGWASIETSCSALLPPKDLLSPSVRSTAPFRRSSSTLAGAPAAGSRPGSAVAEAEAGGSVGSQPRRRAAASPSWAIPASPRLKMTPASSRNAP